MTVEIVPEIEFSGKGVGFRAPNDLREWSEPRTLVKVVDFGGGMCEAVAVRRDWSGVGWHDACVLGIPTQTPRRYGRMGCGGESLPPKRESDAERSLRRAVQQLRYRAKSMKADRMLTVTYRENMQDKVRLERDWKAFVERVKRRVKDFRYVAVCERQERGAWHIHAAVRGRQEYNLLRKLWRDVVGEGNIDVGEPRKFGGAKSAYKRIPSYLCKYLRKDFGNVLEGKKRYWSSRNILPPVVVKFWFEHAVFADIIPVMWSELAARGSRPSYWNGDDANSFFWLTGS